MAYDLSRYDESYGRSRAKTNVFGWSIAILLLLGLTFAAWLGSFYIFGQPERPQSYRILKKLHKIDPMKRFELTAAPAGEFLSAKQLYERYDAMRPSEVAKVNAELARNYIRNFQQVRGLVTYVVGRFDIMEARELTNNDLFTSGMVAMTAAVDNGELLMEHVYPAEQQAVPLMKQTLAMGLELKLERTHDLSAVLHVDRLADGRILITAVPLLYGTYTVTRGTGTFSLEPPLELNMAAGWPMFKESSRHLAETHYQSYREKLAPREGAAAIPGISPTGTPPPPENSLVRVESAIAVEPPKVVAANSPPAKPTPTPKGWKPGKNQKKGATLSPAPSAAKSPAVVAQKPVPATATPAASSSPAITPVQPITPSVTPAVAAASPNKNATPVPVASAQPAPGDALASTAGGATWKTYAPGKMPTGRLINTSDLGDVAERGLAGERLYLRGQFVVNFAEGTRAVLRPKTGLTNKVLHFGSGESSARIIVEFPAGYTPPKQGSIVSRDEARPYEITEVRKQDDGQLNVFVREIMQ